MPERARLTEFIIEHNLIQPFREILSKTKNIETELIKRIEERKKIFLSDKDYLFLFREVMRRFVLEVKGENEANLPPLPLAEGSTLQNMKSFVSVIDQKVNSVKMMNEERGKKEMEAFIERTVFTLESLLGRVFKKEIVKAKIGPVYKGNQKFIQFLRSYLPEEKS